MLFEYLKRLLVSSICNIFKYAGFCSAGLFKRDFSIAKAQLGYVRNFLSSETNKSHVFQTGDKKISTTLASSPILKKNPSTLARQCFGNAFQCVGELLFVDFFIKRLKITNPNSLFECDNFPELESWIRDAQARSIPIIALSAHISCAELLAAFYCHNDLPVTIISRIQRNKLAQTTQENLRKKTKTDTIWRHLDPKLDNNTSKFIKAFKNGKMVAILIDQDSNQQGKFYSHFGMEAGFPSGMIRLLIKYNYPVFTAFLVRTSSLKFKVISEKIEYDPQDPEAEDKIMKIYISRLETILINYPEQWFWWHRRWRRRPNVDYQKNPELLISNKEYLKWLADRAAEIKEWK